MEDGQSEQQPRLWTITFEDLQAAIEIIPETPISQLPVVNAIFY